MFEDLYTLGPPGTGGASKRYVDLCEFYDSMFALRPHSTILINDFIFIICHNGVK